MYVDQNLVNGRFLNEGELITRGGEVSCRRCLAGAVSDLASPLDATPILDSALRAGGVVLVDGLSSYLFQSSGKSVNGLIISKSGPNGGTLLAKKPSEITLDEIYSAVESDNELFHFHYKEPNSCCPIGANISQVLHNKLGKLNQMVIEYLSTITLKEIMDETLRMSGVMDYLEKGYSAEHVEKMMAEGNIIPQK